MQISADTLLEAVNRVISIVGQDPVNSLVDGTSVDVINALEFIEQEKKRLCTRGWWFNTETVTLRPNALDGLIPANPSFILMAAPRRRLVVRDEYLYDLDAGTNRFSAPVTMQVIRNETFEDLPAPARNYIVAKATRRFQARFMGAAELDAEAGQEETEAWQNLQEFELDFGQYNILTDNRTVMEMGER